MRFIHLSDLHIGLKLLNKDLGEDQRYILRQIVKKAKELSPGAVVIAGDIYDKSVPSADAVELFDDFIGRLSRALPDTEIMMISGNHDSAQRINVFRSVLQEHRIHMIGLPPADKNEYIEKVTLHDEFGPVHFYLLPFVKPFMVRKITGTRPDGTPLSYNESVRRLIERENIHTEERNVLVSHQFYLPKGTDPDSVERAESEVRTVGNIDEVDADILERFDYAALGHIHKAMKAGGDAYRYCGTPLACSFSEAGQVKGMILADLQEKGSITTEFIPLTPKRQVRIITGTLEDVLKQSCRDYVRAELTDPDDLDILDMQDRLRHAFPNLLDIRRVVPGKETAVSYGTRMEKEMDPFELCCEFLKDPDDSDRDILADVINTVREAHK